MSREVKIGTKFYPIINTKFSKFRDESSFELKIIKMEDGSEVANSGSGEFEEIIVSPNGHNGKTNGTVAIGDKVIHMKNDHTIIKGDVISDGNDPDNLYYVTNVNGNVLELKEKIKAEIPDDTTINTVGNTGVYKVECQIDSIGEYLVIIKHPDIYHNHGLKYIVTNNTIDDSVENANNRFDAIEDKLDNLNTSKTLNVVV